MRARASAFPGQISVALILSANNAPQSRALFRHVHPRARSKREGGGREAGTECVHANMEECTVMIIMRDGRYEG